MKKLIFCFDGTGNELSDANDYFKDSSITNILKLHLYLGGSLNHTDKPVIDNQISFYYPGIGTKGNWFRKLVNKLIAPSFGDTRRIIAKANIDLQKHYQIGDQIYIFGFSRGAAIARVFGAKLNYPVKFLGVFDTVSATIKSLDLNPRTFPSNKILFENQSLGEHINEAVHLLALDEKRLVYQPTLFNQDPKVTEVWFAGAHSDIGGGYWHDGLSDVCLEYMLLKIAPYLNTLTMEQFDQTRLTQMNLCFDDLMIKPLELGPAHEQEFNQIKSALLSPRLVRVHINETPIDTKVQQALIHESVINRFNQLTHYRPYALRNSAFRVINNQGEISDPVHGLYQIISDERPND